MSEAFGLPVTGDISYYSSRQQIAQRPIEELSPKIHRALAEGWTLRWIQYTPYFNDGDACVFSIHTISALPEDHPALVEGTDEYDDFDAYEHDWDSYKWDDSAPEPPEPVKDACAALEGGQFENALLKAFGDPATVTVTKDGVTVDECDHG